MNLIKKYSRKIKFYAKSSYNLYSDNHIELLPAHIAFFTLWSLVPIVLLWDVVVKVFSFTGLDLDDVSKMYIQDVTDGLNNINTSFEFSRDWSAVVFLLFIIYLSSKAFEAIIKVTNYIYGLEEETNFLLVKLKGMFLSVIVMVSFVAILTISVLGTSIVEFIQSEFTDYNFLSLIELLKWPTTFVFIFTIVFVVYYSSTSRVVSWKLIIPGTAFTTFGWVFATYAYSIYVNEYADYSKIFSGFSSIVVLLIWIYILSVILIVGLVINATYFKEKLLNASKVN